MENEKICPIEKTIKFLSNKWTLLILKNLGEKKELRFNELLTKLNGISPRTLSKRLKELEDEKFINRKKFNEIPPKVEYSLTKKGKNLMKSLIPLIEWAEEN